MLHHIITKPLFNTVVPACVKAITDQLTNIGRDLTTTTVRLYRPYSINNFIEWVVYKQKLLKYASFKGDRVYVWDKYIQDVKTAPLEPGLGRHWFIWKKRLYWVYFVPDDSEHRRGVSKYVAISTFGTSQVPLRELLNEFMDTDNVDTKIVINNFRNGRWVVASVTESFTFDDLVLDETTEKSLKKVVYWWRDNEEWYKKFKRERKLSILLYGEPGTGKTSIARAIAGELHLPICRISMAEHTDVTLRDAVDNAPDECVLSLDDLDGCLGTHHRADQMQASQHRPPPLSITTILDILQGVSNLDGKVVVMTTNYPEHIDPEVIRPSRVDLKLEILPSADKEIREYISRHYEMTLDEIDTLFPGVFPATPGSSLSTLFGLHPSDVEAFARSVYSKTIG